MKKFILSFFLLIMFAGNPNPFNPTTQINVNIPFQSQVNLTVFDISGREVQSLQDGELIPGSYTFAWNASSLPSGIYFARLKTEKNSGESFSNTIKMVLTK